MKSSKIALITLFAVLVVGALVEPAHATITWSNNVVPTDPKTWEFWTTVFIGTTDYGSVMVNGASDLKSRISYIGYGPGSTGTVTVDGAGSTWTNSEELNVGNSGSGKLNITNGGLVSVDGETHVALLAGSSGSINFGPGGGTLETQSLYAAPSQLTGTGTIYTRGLVSDVDLVFDSTHGANQTLTLDSQVGQNVTINLYLPSGTDSVGNLGVGYHGNGSLDIRDGVTITSQNGIVGYHPGSTGIVTINGPGSTWINNAFLSRLDVGYEGSGTLEATDGATLSNRHGYIGLHTGSMGTVRIDGTGSTWINTGYLSIGYEGNGSLEITDGGMVSTEEIAYIGHRIGSTGTVTIDGAGSRWTNNSELFIGSSGNGTLEITGGGTLSNTTAHIESAYSLGTATVSGVGSTWTCTSDLNVGRRGSGTLRITDGGFVSVAGTTNVVTYPSSSGTIDFGSGGGTLKTQSLYATPTRLTGTGTVDTRGFVSDMDLVFDSTHGENQTLTLDNLIGQNVTIHLNMSGASGSVGDLGVGYQGDGSLNIRDGVTITSQNGIIGDYHGSTGTATVDGPGSTWINNSTLHVGHRGSGTLSVTGSGTLNTAVGEIGYEAGSTGVVTVDGVGSTWNNSASLHVGNEGNGELNITGGGTVSNAGSYLAFAYNSAGAVTVDGVGSTWNIGSITVGHLGSATIDITDGGAVTCTSLFRIGRAPGSRGTVKVDGNGSTLTNDGNFTIGVSGSGTLNITNNGTVSNTNGHIGIASGSTGEVTVNGSGSTWTNSGDLFVGESGSGTLSITGGGLTSVAGSLTIDNDLNGDSFINMSSGGMLALFGEADDSLVDFLSLVEGTDAISYWDHSVSDWADIRDATYGDDYTLSYRTEGDLVGYTVLTMSVPNTSLPGDANCDGVVNGVDAAVVARYWKTDNIAFWGMGDLNGDGAVNDIDATLLAANLQTSCNDPTLIPEPSILSGLLVLCVAGVLGGGRRKR